jgi:hypothetical protein
LRSICGDGLLSRAFQSGLGARGVGLGLIADRLQPGDALLQAGVAQIGDTGFDGVIEPPEPEVSLRGALVQLGDMLAPPLGPCDVSLTSTPTTTISATGGGAFILPS